MLTFRFHRNHVPWTIIGICYVACAFLLLAIRWLLARRNKEREGEAHDTAYDDVYVLQTDDEGKTVEVKVAKVRTSYTSKGAVR